MLALWVSLSRSRSGKVCAEFKKKKKKKKKKKNKKKKEKKGPAVTCCLEIYLLEEEAINVFFHRAIFRNVFFFHIHKEDLHSYRQLFTRPSASRFLSTLAPRSYQPFCTRSLRNDACQEIHGVTVSGSAKIAYCFPRQNIALFLSSILKSNVSLWYQV